MIQPSLQARRPGDHQDLRRDDRLTPPPLSSTPAASSRAIADLCGVGDDLVQAVRQVPESGTCPPTRLGRDGKQYPAKRLSSASENAREDSAKDGAEESDSDREAPDAAKDRAREEWQDWSAFEDAAKAARDAIEMMESAHIAAKRREMAHAVCGKLAARCKALAARYSDDD